MGDAKDSPDEIDAAWHEGRSSRSVAAKLWLDRHGGRLRARNEEGAETMAAPRKMKISSRIGNAPRTLDFPDGVTLVVRDNDALDALLRAAGGRRRGGAHLFEHNLKVMVPAILLAAGVAYLLFDKGLPVATDAIAWRLPPTLLDGASKNIREQLDGELLHDTRLSADKRRDIRELFEEVIADLPGEREISLEVVRMGWLDEDGSGFANAFAFPHGLVSVSDRILEISPSRDASAFLLAHEIEHIRQRHSIRSIVRSSVMAFAIGLLTGDVSGLVSLPIILAELKYNRAYEQEADCLAYVYLDSKGMDRDAGMLLLESIEEDRPFGERDPDDAVDAEPGEEEIRQTGNAEEPAGENANDPDDEATTGEKDEWEFTEAMAGLFSTHPLTEERSDPDVFCRDWLATENEASPQQEDPY